MKIKIVVLTMLMLVAHQSARAGELDSDPLVDRVIRSSWRGATPEGLARLKQDQTQAACSQHRNTPPAEIATSIVERERATIRYPESGKLTGDWRKGEKLADSGYGGRIGAINADDPKKPNGGNCYACHALDPKNPAFGNLGPSLAGYGALRGNDADITKYTYDKIYNAQAVAPCSNMPRFGYHGFLSLDQITDLVAYLIDPASPVNSPK